MKKLLLCFFLLSALKNNSQNIGVSELEINFEGDSYPQRFAKGITKLYFAADDDITGQELWAYDQVTDSTYLVKDIFSGSDGLNNSLLMTIGDILYFTVNRGTQLWRSDGTAAGTYLIKLISSSQSSNNTISELIEYNGKVFFGANNDVNGNELWVSDGTTAGTVMVNDIRPGSVGSNPYGLFVFNGNLFFIANDGTNGRELWKSDGTTVGTQILKNIDGTNLDSVPGGNAIILNNAFYFYAGTSSNGYELWKSDGTAAGTVLFKDIVPGTESSGYGLIGKGTTNYFIFEVFSSSQGTELWKCDGTVAGTTLLKDISPGISSGVSETTLFAVLNNKIYFNAYTSINGIELWGTDGTTNGTQLIKEIRTGKAGSNISQLTATSNYLIFAAQSDLHSYITPWKSDGTTAGTFELKDINLSGTTAGELSFGEFNNWVYFPAGYNSPNGTELWKTDGTQANTKLYKDITHRYSGVTGLYDVAEINNRIIYTGMTNYPPAQSNGTINGTSVLSNIYAGFDGFSDQRVNAFYTKAGNTVFFKAGTPSSGYELWKTDGTSANTVMVKDIRPGNSSSLTNSPLFISFNNIFYFKADDGIHGEELWRSDGTNTGTYILKDINIGTGSSLDGQSNIYYDDFVSLNENNYAIMNGFLYFSAYDGTDSSIWRTDGTESGTIKVITIPSAGSSDVRRRVINATGNKIFFKSNTDNSSYGNHSLWSSDGTQAGTIFLGLWNITSTQFKKNIVHNNELYFTVEANPNGLTLMKSDGTVSGTRVIKDNFTSYNTFNSLKSCGNYVYFGIGGQSSATKELWRTDGTPAGTIKLGDTTGSIWENFSDYNVCHQNNLLYLKRFDDNKIWYVNGNSTDSSAYLTTSVTSAAPFAIRSNYSIGALYESSFGLFFTGSSIMGGNELYYTNFDITLDTPENANDGTLNSIILYPNPAKDRVYFKMHNGEIVSTISVYDLLGKKILSSAIANNELDISAISNGIYIINIFTDKSHYNTKLVIKK